ILMTGLTRLLNKGKTRSLMVAGFCPGLCPVIRSMKMRRNRPEILSLVLQMNPNPFHYERI
ncbi:MAG TPA: hypothetical protein VJ876_07535, partial [Bacteroidales bacterium]|nr:hypothetical protein [Bacteroidales bacterium]